MKSDLLSLYFVVHSHVCGGEVRFKTVMRHDHQDHEIGTRNSESRNLV